MAAMQLSVLLCLVLLSLPVGGLGHHHSPATKRRVRELPAVPTAAPAPRDFTFDLFRALVAASPGQNVVFSPLSISVTLAMISLGARSNTKAQILEGLGVRPQGDAEEQLHRGFQQLLQELGRPREDLQLSLGNALFVRPSAHVRDTFLSAARTRYLADTLPTNFGDPPGAQKQINDYVAKQTKGKIVDLVQHLDGTEVLVLVNYIFFKGKAPPASHLGLLFLGSSFCSKDPRFPPTQSGGTGVASPGAQPARSQTRTTGRWPRRASPTGHPPRPDRAPGDTGSRSVHPGSAARARQGHAGRDRGPREALPGRWPEPGARGRVLGRETR